MQVVPEITNADLMRAESLLLPAGCAFDDERREFIRRLDTLDLHAVPGSGKTTALLAKLFILEQSLPLKGGAGVLVLSHTNAAVDEIRKKLLPFCDRLFCYPNFVGTIQSFVDTFLALPYYACAYKRQPIRIDNELYEEATSMYPSIFLPNFTPDQQNNAKRFLRVNECSATYRFRWDGQKPILTKRINGPDLEFRKPQSRVDWSPEEKRMVGEWLRNFKLGLMARGVLCFDDAYFLSSLYLSKRPGASAIIRNRFRYVFVDEMQDMAAHQHDLLETLFSQNSLDGGAYQRIGDRNQSIHDTQSSDLDCVWKARPTSLAFSNSCRLSPAVAKVLEPFAFHREAGFSIKGLGKSALSPSLLVFNDKSISTVILEFSARIQEAMNEGQLPPVAECVFKVVGWNTVWSDVTTETAAGKRRLIDYWPHFETQNRLNRAEHPNLISYINSIRDNAKALKPASDIIMRAILKALQLEKLVHPDLKVAFTKTTLRTYLRENRSAEYDRMRIYIHQWSIAVMNGCRNQVCEEVRWYIGEILHVFGTSIKLSVNFISESIFTPVQQEPISRFENIVNHHGFDIEIASVHKVKGQTHTATLYLETAFHRDGSGATAKSYESQRLAAQFLGNAMTGKEGERTKQSSKMVYVGFSRPTHLLFVGVHESHYLQYLTSADSAGWNIIRI